MGLSAGHLSELSISPTLVPASLPEPSGASSHLCRAPVQHYWPLSRSRTVKSSVYEGQGDSSCMLLGLLPNELHIEKPASPKAGLEYVVIPITHPSPPEHIPQKAQA